MITDNITKDLALTLVADMPVIPGQQVSCYVALYLVSVSNWQTSISKRYSENT